MKVDIGCGFFVKNVIYQFSKAICARLISLEKQWNYLWIIVNKYQEEAVLCG